MQAFQSIFPSNERKKEKSKKDKDKDKIRKVEEKEKRRRKRAKKKGKHSGTKGTIGSSVSMEKKAPDHDKTSRKRKTRNEIHVFACFFFFMAYQKTSPA